MTQIDEHGRPEPPFVADETTMMLAFLDYQRATLRWKCAGLDSSGLSATTAASTMTLGGLLKHMALVEDNWFQRWLQDREMPSPWNTVDWKAQPDWEFETAADDTPQQLFDMWDAAVARSREAIDRTLASGGVDQLAKRAFPDGRSPSVCWILCHMIEEYARHNGHADLLREAVDGETGE